MSNLKTLSESLKNMAALIDMFPGGDEAFDYFISMLEIIVYFSGDRSPEPRTASMMTCDEIKSRFKFNYGDKVQFENGAIDEIEDRRRVNGVNQYQVIDDGEWIDESETSHPKSILQEIDDMDLTTPEAKAQVEKNNKNNPGLNMIEPLFKYKVGESVLFPDFGLSKITARWKDDNGVFCYKREGVDEWYAEYRVKPRMKYDGRIFAPDDPVRIVSSTLKKHIGLTGIIAECQDNGSFVIALSNGKRSHFSLDQIERIT